MAIVARGGTGWVEPASFGIIFVEVAGRAPVDSAVDFAVDFALESMILYIWKGDFH